jgi:hypothetical protein
MRLERLVVLYDRIQGVIERGTARSRAIHSRKPAGKPFFPMPHDYKELGIFTIPEDVPELGVKAGDSGTIAGVYEGGHLLDLEIGREDGTSVGFVDVRIDKDGTSHVVGYSPFGA